MRKSNVDTTTGTGTYRICGLITPLPIPWVSETVSLDLVAIRYTIPETKSFDYPVNFCRGVVVAW